MQIEEMHGTYEHGFFRRGMPETTAEELPIAIGFVHHVQNLGAAIPCVLANKPATVHLRHYMRQALAAATDALAKVSS